MDRHFRLFNFFHLSEDVQLDDKLCGVVDYITKKLDISKSVMMDGKTEQICGM